MNYTNRENCIHLYFGEGTVSGDGTARLVPIWQVLGMTPHSDDSRKERVYLQVKSPVATNDADKILFTLKTGIAKKTFMAELCKIMHGRGNNKTTFINVYNAELNEGASSLMTLIDSVAIA